MRSTAPLIITTGIVRTAPIGRPIVLVSFYGHSIAFFPFFSLTIGIKLFGENWITGNVNTANYFETWQIKPDSIIDFFFFFFAWWGVMVAVICSIGLKVISVIVSHTHTYTGTHNTPTRARTHAHTHTCTHTHTYFENKQKEHVTRRLERIKHLAETLFQITILFSLRHKQNQIVIGYFMTVQHY